ncbi:hypothetical protein J2S01_000622 [Pectinatus haikarae]|uniref:Uncharacterized protein n=1 Tax=Pectinatus haikarae TaxID=349096 RepID=A0ABT9Y515_9FIRM|nr:hypothetical protein [Pectinatus haikarae]
MAIVSGVMKDHKIKAYVLIIGFIGAGTDK